MQTIDTLLNGSARNRVRRQFAMIRKTSIDVTDVLGSACRELQQKYTVTVVGKSGLVVRADKKRNVPFIVDEIENLLSSLLPNRDIDVKILFSVIPSGSEINVRAKRYNG